MDVYASLRYVCLEAGDLPVVSPKIYSTMRPMSKAKQSETKENITSICPNGCVFQVVNRGVFVEDGALPAPLLSRLRAEAPLVASPPITGEPGRPGQGRGQ